MRVQRPKYIDDILLRREYTKLLRVSSGKAVVLLSGGIDSTVAMVLAKKSGLEVIGLEFSYDKRPAQETTNVDEICEITKTELYKVGYPTPLRKHPFNMQETEKIEIPESNSLYYSIAGGFAREMGLEYVIGGQILNDRVNSKNERSTPNHYKTLNELLKREYEPNHPRILMPLIYLNKIEVVRIGLSLGAPLDLTWSCPNNNTIPCGDCVQCLEREEAFRISDDSK